MTQVSCPNKRLANDEPDILKLPLAALGQCFRALDSWKDGLRLSLVCRQLRDVGKPYLQRTVACVNCLNSLCNAAVASEANAGSRSLPFSLDDGDAMCLGEPENIIPGSIRFEEEALCKSRCLHGEFLRLRISGSTKELGLKVRIAHCNGCNLYLGVQIMEIKGLRLGDDLDMSSWRLGLLLGNIFIPARYLCALRLDGIEDTTLPGITWQDRAPRKVYKCAMKKLRSGANGTLEGGNDECGLPLFYDRAILSKDHWWKAQDVPSPMLQNPNIPLPGFSNINVSTNLPQDLQEPLVNARFDPGTAVDASTANTPPAALDAVHGAQELVEGDPPLHGQDITEEEEEDTELDLDLSDTSD